MIDSVDAVDPNTVKINFKNPTPGWYGVFCGAYGYILPQHILKDSVGAEARNAPFNLKPIGTGPYKVDEFQSGDHVSYSINDKFRDPDKPFFKTVYLKGGGDAPVRRVPRSRPVKSITPGTCRSSGACSSHSRVTRTQANWRLSRVLASSAFWST